MSLNLDKEKLVLDSKLLHHLSEHIQDGTLKVNLDLIRKDLDDILDEKSESLTYEELFNLIQVNVGELKQKALLLQEQTKPPNRPDFKTERLMETIEKWQQDLALLSYFK